MLYCLGLKAWDLGSLIMDRTHPSAVEGEQSIGPPGKSLKHFRIRPGQPGWVRADVHPLNAFRGILYVGSLLRKSARLRQWEKLSLWPVPAACTLGWPSNVPYLTYQSEAGTRRTACRGYSQWPYLGPSQPHDNSSLRQHKGLEKLIYFTEADLLS